MYLSPRTASSLRWVSSMKFVFFVFKEPRVTMPLSLLIAGYARGWRVNAVHGGEDGVDLVNLRCLPIAFPTREDLVPSPSKYDKAA